MSEDWVLAIDFGTTTTAAAVRATDEDRAELVRFGDGYRIPSAVLLSHEGELVAGPQVDREAELYPERVERFPKRQLGQGKVLLVDTWFDDVDLVGAVLAHVYRQARSQYDDRVPVAVRLTHPSRWEGLRQESLRQAAERAGLPPVVLLSEPVAAARGLTRRRSEKVGEGQKVGVFDFGGGTLDIALLERRGDTFVVIGEPGGDDHLGGEDIDDLLITFLASKLSLSDRERLFDSEGAEDPAVWRRAAFTFARQVKLAKESLATGRVQRLALPSPPLDKASIELVESEVNAAVGATVQRSVERLHATIRRSGLSVDDLVQVYLVGGSSRLALVQRKLGPGLGERLVSIGDPKGMVALGAAEVPLAVRPTERDSAPMEAPRGPTPERLVHRETGRVQDLPGGPTPRRAPMPDRAGPVGPAPVHRGPTGAAAPLGNGRARPPGRRPDSSAPTQPAGPQARGDRPYRLLAGDLYQQIGWPPRAHLIRWLVGEGDHVTLGTPLAMLADVGNGSSPRTVISPYAGVLARFCSVAGRLVEAREPLADFTSVEALTLGACRLDARAPGIVLDVAPPPPGRPTCDAALVRIDGAAYSLMFRNRFAFVLPPGEHQTDVTARFGNRWGPAARTRVDVQAGRQRLYRYVPPSDLRQPGRIWQE